MTSRVLLTGASGFVASHILDTLLKKGYWVRCTVRSESKKQEILAASSAYTAQLDFVIVPDIAIAGAFDAAVVADPGLDAIIHTASPFHFAAKDVRKDMLDPAIQGTVGVLQAAKKFAPTVKRVVITSSFAAIVDGSAMPGPPGKAYTEADWNPMTWEQAISQPWMAYVGSKAFAERAAWDFIRDEKPGFDLVSLNPPMIFGPIINSKSASALNESNKPVHDILSGTLPPTIIHLWVDVRDVAKAHVLALETPEAANERFFISAGVYSMQDIADILRKHFPGQPVAEGKPGSGLGLPEGSYYVDDNSKSKKILGMTYGSLEDAIIPLAKNLLALDK